MKWQYIALVSLVVAVMITTGIVMGATIPAEKLNPVSVMKNPTPSSTDVQTALQHIAADYTAASRLGWKVAVNGIDENPTELNWDIGYGSITGYNPATGVLTGQGRMYRVSPDRTSMDWVTANPAVESLDDATIGINVNDNTMTISTSGSDPGSNVAWAALLGSYAKILEGQTGIFYGFGTHQTMTGSMCILTLTNAPAPAGYVGTPGASYNYGTNTSTVEIKNISRVSLLKKAT